MTYKIFTFILCILLINAIIAIWLLKDWNDDLTVIITDQKEEIQKQARMMIISTEKIKTLQAENYLQKKHINELNGIIGLQRKKVYKYDSMLSRYRARNWQLIKLWEDHPNKCGNCLAKTDKWIKDQKIFDAEVGKKLEKLK